MRALAPGKVVLTGAYAVLAGAPAIVAAIDRYAIADAGRVALSPAPEVRAAFGDEPAPAVDVSALGDASGRKLGLGSSAAAVVAALAAGALTDGADLRSDVVRAHLFRDARRAHAQAQGGGSGADVAASVYGGVLSYRLDGAEAAIRPAPLPRSIVLAAYFSGASARTSDFLARVAAFRANHPGPHAELADLMAETAHRAAGALEDGADLRFVHAACGYGKLLARLGHAADAPIVPLPFAELGSLAEDAGAAFLPSGAGGGDVGLWIGTAPPSAEFSDRAEALGLSRLALGIDCDGVRQAAPV